MSEVTRAVVFSLGSNLGDRLANLQLGLDRLAGPGLAMTAVSGVYQTAPVGGPEQADFLNAVLVGRSDLPPASLLSRCAGAESAAGRVREIRWGPRSLDVDIIAYGELRSDDPDLTLPHPRAHERAFVLLPWLEVEPDAALPGWGPARSLAAATGAAGVRLVPELKLRLPGGSGPEAPAWR